MKKILCSLLLIFVVASLSGCKSGNDIIIDKPSNAINQALNLDALKEGTALNVDKDTSAPYYDVKVSKEISSSLFYQAIDINEYVLKGNASINVKPLAFNETFFDSTNSTLVELINILNDEKEGISKEDLGVELTDDDFSAYLVGNLTTTNNITIPTGVVSNEQDPIKLVVVYLPIYGIYTVSEKQFTNVFLMIPVYYAIVNESKVVDYAGSVKEYECELVEVSQNKWVLASENE